MKNDPNSIRKKLKINLKPITLEKIYVHDNNLHSSITSRGKLISSTKIKNQDDQTTNKSSSIGKKKNMINSEINKSLSKKSFSNQNNFLSTRNIVNSGNLPFNNEYLHTIGESTVNRNLVLKKSDSPYTKFLSSEVSEFKNFVKKLPLKENFIASERKEVCLPINKVENNKFLSTTSSKNYFKKKLNSKNNEIISNYSLTKFNSQNNINLKCTKNFNSNLNPSSNKIKILNSTQSKIKTSNNDTVEASYTSNNLSNNTILYNFQSTSPTNTRYKILKTENNLENTNNSSSKGLFRKSSCVEMGKDSYKIKKNSILKLSVEKNTSSGNISTISKKIFPFSTYSRNNKDLRLQTLDLLSKNTFEISNSLDKNISHRKKFYKFFTQKETEDSTSVLNKKTINNYEIKIIEQLRNISFIKQFAKYKLFKHWYLFSNYQKFCFKRNKLNNNLKKNKLINFDNDFKKIINFNADKLIRIKKEFVNQEVIINPHIIISKYFNYKNDNFTKIIKEISKFKELYENKLKNQIFIKSSFYKKSIVISSKNDRHIYHIVYIILASNYLNINHKFFKNVLKFLNNKIEYSYEIRYDGINIELESNPDTKDGFITIQKTINENLNKFQNFEFLRKISELLSIDICLNNDYEFNYFNKLFGQVNSSCESGLSKFKDKLEYLITKSESMLQVIKKNLNLFNKVYENIFNFDKKFLNELNEILETNKLQIEEKYNHQNLSFNFKKVKNKLVELKNESVYKIKNKIISLFNDNYQLIEEFSLTAEKICSQLEKDLKPNSIDIENLSSYLTLKKEYTNVNTTKDKIENFLNSSGSEFYFLIKKELIFKLKLIEKKLNKIFEKLDKIFTNENYKKYFEKELIDIRNKSKEYSNNLNCKLEKCVNLIDRNSKIDSLVSETQNEFLNLKLKFCNKFEELNIIYNLEMPSSELDNMNETRSIYQNLITSIKENLSSINENLNFLTNKVKEYFCIEQSLEKINYSISNYKSNFDKFEWMKKFNEMMNKVNILFNNDPDRYPIQFLKVLKEKINLNLYGMIKVLISDDLDLNLNLNNIYYKISKKFYTKLDLNEIFMKKCFTILLVHHEINKYENFVKDIRKIEKKIIKIKIIIHTFSDILYKSLMTEVPDLFFINKFELIISMVSEFLQILNEYLKYKNIIDTLMHCRANSEEPAIIIEEEILISIIKIMLTIYLKFKNELILEELKDFISINCSNIQNLLNIKNDFNKLISIKYPKVFYLNENDMITFILLLLSDITENNLKTLNYLYNKINKHSIFLDNNLIIGVNHNSTNLLEFQNKISIFNLNNNTYNKDIIGIFYEIESEIKFTLKFNLISSLNNFSKSNFFDWIFSDINQIMICSLNLIFANEVTQILVSSMEANAENISGNTICLVKNKMMEKTLKSELQILLNKYNYWMDLISKKLSFYYSNQLEHSNFYRNKSNFPNLLITLQNHKNIIENLILNKITESDSYEWLKYIRHMWDNTRKEIIVECGGWTSHQILNYIGNYSRILISPQTDKIFLFNASCFREKSAAFLKINSSSLGYLEIFKELASNLWIEVFTLDVTKYFFNSSIIPFDNLKKILDVCLSSKKWIFLDNIDALNIENSNINCIFFISKIMQTIQQEIILNEIKQEDSNLKLNMFCLMGCIKLDENIKNKEIFLKSSSRILNIVKPDLKFFTSNLFSIYGNNIKNLSSFYYDVLTNIEKIIKNKTPQFSFDFYSINFLKNFVFDKLITTCKGKNTSLFFNNSNKNFNLESDITKLFIKILFEFVSPLVKNFQISDDEIIDIFNIQINNNSITDLIGNNLKFLIDSIINTQQENKIKNYLEQSNKLYSDDIIKILYCLDSFYDKTKYKVKLIPIIYGQPGCGKTTLINNFLEYLKNVNKKNIEIKYIYQYELVNNIWNISNTEEIGKEFLYNISLKYSTQYIGSVIHDIKSLSENIFIEMTSIKDFSNTDFSGFQLLHLSNLKYKKLVKYFIQSINNRLKSFEILINDEYNLSIIEFINKLFNDLSDELKFTLNALYYKTIELHNTINLFVNLINSEIKNKINKSFLFNIVVQSILIVFNNDLFAEENDKLIRITLRIMKKLSKSIIKQEIFKDLEPFLNEDFNFYLDCDTFTLKKFESSMKQGIINNNLIIVPLQFYSADYYMNLCYQNRSEILLIGNKFRCKSTFIDYFINKYSLSDRLLRFDIYNSKINSLADLIKHKDNFIYIDDMNMKRYSKYEYLSLICKNKAFICAECDDKSDLFYNNNKIHFYFNSNCFISICKVILNNYLSEGVDNIFLQKIFVNYIKLFSEILDFRDLNLIKHSFEVFKGLKESQLLEEDEEKDKIIFSFINHSRIFDNEYKIKYSNFLKENFYQSNPNPINNTNKLKLNEFKTDPFNILKSLLNIVQNKKLKVILIISSKIFFGIFLNYTVKTAKIKISKNFSKLEIDSNRGKDLINFLKINKKSKIDLDDLNKLNYKNKKIILYTHNEILNENMKKFDGLIVNIKDNEYFPEANILNNFSDFHISSLKKENKFFSKNLIKEKFSKCLENIEFKTQFNFYLFKLSNATENFKNEKIGFNLLDSYLNIDGNLEFIKKIYLNENALVKEFNGSINNDELNMILDNFELYLNEISIDDYESNLEKLLSNDSGLSLINYFQKIFLLNENSEIKTDFLVFISNKFSLLVMIKYFKNVELRNLFITEFDYFDEKNKFNRSVIINHDCYNKLEEHFYNLHKFLEKVYNENIHYWVTNNVNEINIEEINYKLKSRFNYSNSRKEINNSFNLFESNFDLNEKFGYCLIVSVLLSLFKEIKFEDDIKRILDDNIILDEFLIVPFKYSNLQYFIDFLIYKLLENSFTFENFFPLNLNLYSSIKILRKYLMTGKIILNYKNIFTKLNDNFHLLLGLIVCNKNDNLNFNKIVNNLNDNMICNLINKSNILDRYSLIDKLASLNHSQLINNNQSNSASITILPDTSDKLNNDIFYLIESALFNYKNLLGSREILNTNFFYCEIFKNYYDHEKLDSKIKNDYYVNIILEKIYLSLNNKFLFTLLMTLEIMLTLNEISKDEIKFIVDSFINYYEISDDNCIKTSISARTDIIKIKEAKKLIEMYYIISQEDDEIFKFNHSFVELLENLIKNNLSNLNQYLETIYKDNEKLLFYIIFFEDQSISYFKFLINKYLKPIHPINNFKINNVLKRKVNHPITIKCNPSINLTNYFCSLAAYYEIEFIIIRKFSFSNNLRDENSNDYKHISDCLTSKCILEALTNGNWLLISTITNQLEFLIIFQIIQNNKMLIHSNFKLFFDFNLINYNTKDNSSFMKILIENYSMILSIDSNSVDDLEAAHDMWVNVLDENLLTETMMQDNQKEFLSNTNHKNNDISSITNKNIINDDFINQDLSDIQKILGIDDT